MHTRLDAVTFTNGKKKTVQLLSSLSSIKEVDRQTETGSAHVDVRDLKPKVGEFIVKANLSCSKQSQGPWPRQMTSQNRELTRVKDRPLTVIPKGYRKRKRH